MADSTSIDTNARLAAASKVQAVCVLQGLGCMPQWATYMAAKYLVQEHWMQGRQRGGLGADLEGDPGALHHLRGHVPAALRSRQHGQAGHALRPLGYHFAPDEPCSKGGAHLHEL